MRRKRVVVFLGLMVMLLAAILATRGSKLPSSAGSPEAPRADILAVARANNALGLALLAVTENQEPGNLVYSPLGLSTTLAMTATGAGGQTQSQLLRALQWTKSVDELALAETALFDLIGGTASGHRSRVETSNALWYRNRLPIARSFKQQLRRQFDADTFAVDFAGRPDKVQQRIDAWIAERSHGAVGPIAHAGGPDPNTALVLTNVVYFRDGWYFPFDPIHTSEKPFYYSPDSPGHFVAVPMMVMTEELSYYEQDGVQVVELPYLSSQQSMLIVLPAAGGLTALETELSSTVGVSRLQSWITGLEAQEVMLELPKVRLVSRLDAATALRWLGVRDLFEQESADLTGMVGKASSEVPLFVTDVIHQAMIEWDEIGTVAAAATEEIAAPAADVSEPPHMIVDHPFLFLLVDKPTGAILFLGRVTDPS